MIRNLTLALALTAGLATAASAADPAAGEKVFKSQCALCHSPVAGRNMIGPSLFGVVGRTAGSVSGFHYSADHKKLGVTWDAATLDKYLTNPRAMVPDTTMTYAGLTNETQRSDLIAYLSTLH
jgi:cytochrome c